MNKAKKGEIKIKQRQSLACHPTSPKEIKESEKEGNNFKISKLEPKKRKLNKNTKLIEFLKRKRFYDHHHGCVMC